jgi:hypothetical protein
MFQKIVKKLFKINYNKNNFNNMLFKGNNIDLQIILMNNLLLNNLIVRINNNRYFNKNFKFKIKIETLFTLIMKIKIKIILHLKIFMKDFI